LKEEVQIAANGNKDTLLGRDNPVDIRAFM
jgi:hypothetical protein